MDSGVGIANLPEHKVLYGMGAVGFRAYAAAAYGVKMTEEEAFQAREAFFNLYSRLLPWHEEVRRYIKRFKHVRSPLGRIRHLPLIDSPDKEARAMAERQGINAQIQSCLSDMMLLAMVLIDREFGQEQVRMTIMTHDSLTVYVKQGEEIEWAKRIKAVMENLPLGRFGWNPPIVFAADAEMAVPDDDGVLSMGKMTKLKNL